MTGTAHPGTTRDVLVDALRGIALLGIVLGNVHSYGLGLPISMIGFLDAASSRADHVTVVLTAFFVQAKFYPIFCFCFGYGFAVLTRKWIARGQDAAQLFSRRIVFLLFIGALHGMLLWAGDILTAYALIALVLARHLGKGPRALLTVWCFWLRVSVGVMLVFALLAGAFMLSPDLTTESLDEARRSFQVYQGASWWAAAVERVGDYLSGTASIVFVFPQVMSLFLLGAITAHRGWLRHPDAHRALWWRVLKVGLLVGLPLNLCVTYLSYSDAVSPNMSVAMLTQALSFGLPIFAAVYVAALVLLAPHRVGQFFIACFAPLGKFALTNYLMQSLILSWLLYGFGAGLARHFQQAEFAMLAGSLFVMQWFASHLYARTGRMGPLEFLWRKAVGEGTIRPRENSQTPRPY